MSLRNSATGTGNVFVNVVNSSGSKFATKRSEATELGCIGFIKRHLTLIFLILIFVNIGFAIMVLTDGFTSCQCDKADDCDHSHKTVKAKAKVQKWHPGSLTEDEIKQTYEFLTTHYKSNYNNPTYLRDIHKDLPVDVNLDSIHWKFNLQISNYAMYLESKSGELVDKIVHSMAHNPIADMMQDDKSGTELKLIATFSDGTVALMKPQRMKRDEEVNPNLYVFSEYERHHSEIAASHLDRILGFNHVPPCTGRLLNISRDIKPFIDDQFAVTIHTSPSGNLCFYGQCVYFCDVHHPYCGDPDSVEVSVCLYLPMKWWRGSPVISPWRRSYGKGSLADWQQKNHNATYCQKLLDREGVYTSSRRLLDVVDMGIFDFLTGNIDRHHYEYWTDFGDNSSLIIFDNGRGFGRYKSDDFSIIPALYQCCAIRKSTYDKLMRLQQGQVKLSDVMRWHMKDDPLAERAPILTEEHLNALDRRLNLTLQIVHNDCLGNKKLRREEVIIDDLL